MNNFIIEQIKEFSKTASFGFALGVVVTCLLISWFALKIKKELEKEESGDKMTKKEKEELENKINKIKSFLEKENK